MARDERVFAGLAGFPAILSASAVENVNTNPVHASVWTKELGQTSMSYPRKSRSGLIRHGIKIFAVIVGLGAIVASAQAAAPASKLPHMGPNQVAASVSKRVKTSGRYRVNVSVRAHRDAEPVSIYLTGAAKRAVRVSSQATTTLHYALTVADAPAKLTVSAISTRPAVQLTMTVERQPATKSTGSSSPPAPAPSAAAPTPPPPAGNQYPNPYTNLVWSDNFSAGVPGSTWSTCSGSCAGGINSYTSSSSNVSVNSSNQLVITATKSGSSYSSAEVVSNSISDSPYGAIEANIKMPSGQGLWPAFWVDGGGSWPNGGEIDIIEAPAFGADPNYAIFTLHGPWTQTDPNDNYQIYETATTALGDLSTGFHTYGVIWTPNSIVWTIDGVGYAQATPSNLVPEAAPWVFNNVASYQVVLDLAVGGWPCNSSGNPVPPPSPCPGASFPAQMVVNWVHVYH
jgi:beta-glucanase (GH16 family)